MDETPAWATRLRAERLRPDRMWSLARMARELRAAAGDRVPVSHPASLRRQIGGWERGEHLPDERYRTLYAVVFDIPVEVLFADPEPPNRAELDTTMMADVGPAAELLSLGRQLEGSDVGQGTLDDLEAAVHGLCCAYPTLPPSSLRRQATGLLQVAAELRAGRLTLRQHREILVQAGWLAALLGCVHFDLDDATAAEGARRLCARLAAEAEHAELAAWSWEMAAWFALVQGRYADVVAACQAGLEHSRQSHAAAQLHLQAARGHARLGEPRATEAAFQQAQALIDRLPTPEATEHHFVIDPTKTHFYGAFVHTWLRRTASNAIAEEHAAEVIHQCTGSGSIRWPTRLGITRILQGTLAGRRGDLDEALAYGHAGLALGRNPAGLVDRAAELVAELAQLYPGETRAGGPVRQLAEVVHDRQAAVSIVRDAVALPPA